MYAFIGNVTPHLISQTVNIGDPVTLTVFSDSNDLRWRHNGGDVIHSLNGKKSYTITRANIEHAGIYECHLPEGRSEGKQAITQLIVRGL